jgi:hypothetical protein
MPATSYDVVAGGIMRAMSRYHFTRIKRQIEERHGLTGCQTCSDLKSKRKIGILNGGLKLCELLW